MRYSDFKKQAARIQQDKTLKQAEKNATNPQPQAQGQQEQIQLYDNPGDNPIDDNSATPAKPPMEETTTTTTDPTTGQKTTTKVTKPAAPAVQPQGQQPNMPSINFNAPDNVENTPFKSKEGYYRSQITNFFLANPNFSNAVEANRPNPPEGEQGVVDKLKGGIRAVGSKVAPNLMAANDFNNMDTQGKADVIYTMLQDPNTEKALIDALEKGDMEMFHMLLGNGSGDSKPDANAEAMKFVWQKMTPEQQERFTAAGKKAAWAAIKADPLKNLPNAISLWFKMKGWDQMGEFAQDPLKFYLSLAGILGGGLVLGSMAFGGGSDEQPVVINNGAQQNPYYSGTL